MSRRLAKARALHNWSWVGSWGAYGGWGGPGDAVGDEVGYGIGVVREDANGVAEEAALVGVQRGVEAVAATAFVFLWEHGTDLGRFDFAAGVYAAGENLYGDVFGSEGVEEDTGGNLYVITQRNFAPTVGDGAHLDARPCRVNACAPRSEIAGARGIVGLKSRIAAMGGSLHTVDPLPGQCARVHWREWIGCAARVWNRQVLRAT